jgi:hypothetical protein
MAKLSGSSKIERETMTCEHYNNAATCSKCSLAYVVRKIEERNKEKKKETSLNKLRIAVVLMFVPMVLHAQDNTRIVPALRRSAKMIHLRFLKLAHPRNRIQNRI